MWPVYFHCVFNNRVVVTGLICAWIICVIHKGVTETESVIDSVVKVSF